jgi:hypothetical protein
MRPHFRPRARGGTTTAHLSSPTPSGREADTVQRSSGTGCPARSSCDPGCYALPHQPSAGGGRTERRYVPVKTVRAEDALLFRNDLVRARVAHGESKAVYIIGHTSQPPAQRCKLGYTR